MPPKSTTPDRAALRQIPSVDELLSRPKIEALIAIAGRVLVTSIIRKQLAQLRIALAQGLKSADSAALEDEIHAAVALALTPSLRRVINATGVVLHTNLGRALLSEAAIQHIAATAGRYTNLEYDIATGKRGKRDVHTAHLLAEIVGAQSAIVVNNNAAAIFLVLNTFAKGAEVIVSRGELIEIGDGFRIPDIMAGSGASIREVGTTNRTRIEDYQGGITAGTRLLLRVHPSNFKMEGFTARPELRDLVALGRERGLPVYEDLGSGCAVDLRPFGIEEPLAAESLSAGVDLVSFSGDKLLGGPQAGILAGKPEIVARLRRSPLFRALRVDKIVCQALEHTLRSLLLERWDAVPALAMIRLPAAEIRARAEALVARTPGIRTEIVPGSSLAGGGATPQQSIPTWLIAIECDAPAAERALRAGDPPVIARIQNDKLVLDLRTVFREEEEELAAALGRVARNGAG